jgi:hypothetical protein
MSMYCVLCGCGSTRLGMHSNACSCNSFDTFEFRAYLFVTGEAAGCAVAVRSGCMSVKIMSCPAVFAALPYSTPFVSAIGTFVSHVSPLVACQTRCGRSRRVNEKLVPSVKLTLLPSAN